MTYRQSIFGFFFLLSFLTACNNQSESPQPVSTPTGSWNFGNVIDQRTVGDYDIFLWGERVGLDFAGGYGRFTIERDGQILMTIEQADKFNDAPSDDLTGEGNPDILLQTRRGGSHCCIGQVLIDLGPEPVEIIRSWSSIQGDRGLGEFKDLTNDGIYEIVRADGIEAPCTTPMVKVILEYQPSSGYQPVSQQFPEQYKEDIEFELDRLEEEFARDGSVHHCSIPTIIASYYYMGQKEEAREVFDQYYTADDAEAYWLELIEGIKNGRYYTE